MKLSLNFLELWDKNRRPNLVLKKSKKNLWSGGFCRSSESQNENERKRKDKQILGSCQRAEHEDNGDTYYI